MERKDGRGREGERERREGRGRRRRKERVEEEEGGKGGGGVVHSLLPCHVTPNKRCVLRHHERAVRAPSPRAHGACSVTPSERCVLRHPEQAVHAPSPRTSGACSLTPNQNTQLYRTHGNSLRKNYSELVLVMTYSKHNGIQFIKAHKTKLYQQFAIHFTPSGNITTTPRSSNW